jgi:hypothetical protein
MEFIHSLALTRECSHISILDRNTFMFEDKDAVRHDVQTYLTEAEHAGNAIVVIDVDVLLPLQVNKSYSVNKQIDQSATLSKQYGISSSYQITNSEGLLFSHI